MVFSLIGAYSVRFLMLDVWASLLFGVAGYLMRKFGFPAGPRGPGDDPLPAAGDRAQAGPRHLRGLLRDLLHPSIALAFMLLAFGVILRGLWTTYRARRLEFAEEEAD